MGSESQSVSAREIRAQLARMLASKRFIANENPARFLKLVVEKALKGELITQAVIGLELFPTKYAQNDISDVRVTARNLRKVLAAYYAHEGQHDHVMICLPDPPSRFAPKLPSGKAYQPIFTYNSKSLARKEHTRGLSMLSQLDLVHAEEHFFKAIDLRPGFADPYLDLAVVYLLCPICVTAIWVEAPDRPRYFDSQTWMLLVRRLLACALRIDRNSWRAHIMRGAVHCYQHQWNKARLAFDTAMRLCPEEASHDVWYIAYLVTLGRLDEALANLKARIDGGESDDPILLTEYGFVLYLMRRFKEAYAAFMEASDIDERYWPAWIGRILVLQEAGMKEAWDNINRRQSDYIMDALITYFPGLSVLFSGRAGRRDEAHEKLQGYYGTHVMGAFQMALAYAGLGNMELAAERIQDAFQESHPALLWFPLWPILDFARSDPIFQNAVQQMNLPSSNLA